MIRCFTCVILFLVSFSSLAQLPVTGYEMPNYQPPIPYGYGGDRQVLAFIEREMVYPEEALEEGTEGTVAIFFVTDTNGTTSKVKVVNSVSPEIDAEAIRLFRMLLWHPAEKWKQFQACEHIYRFKFDIGKYKKACKKRGYSNLTYHYQPIDTSNVIHHFAEVKMMPKLMANKMVQPIADYIRDNLVYPDEAYAKNITGTVKLEYVVEPSGNVSNIRVVEHLGGGCTDEAAKLIGNTHWVPGIHEGKAVRTQMMTEITFGLPPQAGPNSYSH